MPFSRPRGQYYHGLLAAPDCSSCPLMHDKQVLPDGPVPARIAFVGEDPGRMELMEGKGFVGPSGQLLWNLAQQAGFTRDDVWVTNAALCPSRPVKLPTGAVLPKHVVKAKAAACCRGRLLRELVTVDPIVVVPLGNWALWSVSDLAHARIFAYRGSRTEVNLSALADLVASGRANSMLREDKRAGK